MRFFIRRGHWCLTARTCVQLLTSVLFAVAPSGIAGELKWQSVSGARWAELPVVARGNAGFTLLPPAATGILFTNVLRDDRSVTNRHLLSGSGVAVGDVDGDGRCDLYFCGLDNANRLYRNRGNWTFEDITDAAGVACPNQDSTGAAFADVDGDGDLDLLVNSLGGGTRIFENDGKGRFTEITDRAVARSTTGSTSMALADVDGNGTLDLYVTNFRRGTFKDEPTTQFQGEEINGHRVITFVNGVPANSPELTNRFLISPAGSILELGEADALYLNDGQGRFTPVSFTDGSFLDEDGRPLNDPPRDWGLAVQFHDFTGDGAPDIYVCNDLFTPDRIWVNDGRGKFRALPRLALRNTSTFSMGVDFGDLDRDGSDDFFVVDMLSRSHQDRHVQVEGSTPVVLPIGEIDNRPQVYRNTLQVNRGDGTFAEIAYYSRVEASEWSWCPIFLDVDLDGYEDILVSNGQMRDFQNADRSEELARMQTGKRFTMQQQATFLKDFPKLMMPNVIFRNRGDLRFEDVSAAWGFDVPDMSYGMALGDLDGDGDLDVVMNNLNGAAGVYRNNAGAPRVAVRLKGLTPNTRGIGAKIWVYGGAVPMQSQEMICGGRYLSSDDPMRVFAAGNLTNAMRIEVKWRNGKRSVIDGVKANRIYEVQEPEAANTKVQTPSAHNPQATSNIEHRTSNVELPTTDNHQPSTINHQPCYEDVSALLGHTHHEEDYDDFERQPLLPRKLSQLGPGVAWHDLDGDGWDELIIGSGRGGQPGVYRNDGKGRFEPMKGPPFHQAVTRDQTTVLGMEAGLMIGSANYEDGRTNGGCVKLYDWARKASGESIMGQSSSTGPLALGDVDGDGDLDLFVGGRVIPGRYPEPASSLLMRNDRGRLTVAQRLEGVGLVSGAVFSDLDGDGKPELVLACEWGPLRVFKYEREKLLPWDVPVTINDSSRRSSTKADQPSTLSRLTGWWNGVTAGDLDGDGRLDLVASNWGLNTRYRTSAEHPRKIYYGDFGSSGVDVIEAYYETGITGEVPDRGLRALTAALPWVRAKAGSYEAYGKARLNDIYAEKLDAAGVVTVNTLETMIFLNRGDHFEARALPREAQWAPAYGVNVGDYDGDGKEDIFLSQNFFAVNGDQGRADGGRGLWLRGDGLGYFSAVPGQESGVKVYGEQRGSALCDYDGDGRVDLVVTQNGAETKLYHNTGAKPGLRVRLRGPAGNRKGIGAVLRLKFKDRTGPAREVHGGSGYWSQDSAVSVMATPQTPTAIEVRWPGGKNTTAAVAPDANEIALDESGNVSMLK
jgi:hypothetical protein